MMIPFLICRLFTVALHLHFEYKHSQHINYDCPYTDNYKLRHNIRIITENCFSCSTHIMIEWRQLAYSFKSAVHRIDIHL